MSEQPIRSDAAASLAQQPSASRDVSLDVLRLFSILSVLMVHTIAGAWSDLDPHTFDWQCANLIDGLSRLGVPCFMMLSGALMLDPKHIISIRTLYMRRILRLLSAWLFWSLCYAARHLISYALYADPASLILFRNSFLGGHYHLWFMGMTIGLSILLPMLRPIAADRRLLKYALIITFALGVFIPSLCIFDALKAPLTSFLDRFYLPLPLGYCFYYFLGFYLYTEPLKRNTKRIIYALGFLGLLVTVIATSLGNLSDPGFGSRLFDNFSLNVVLAAAAAFLLTRDKLHDRIWNPRKAAVLKKATDYTLGIYLVHEWFNLLVPHFGITVLSLPVIVMAPFWLIGCYAFSYAASAVLHRIPFVRDWLV